jgi:hypothetical protein
MAEKTRSRRTLKVAAVLLLAYVVNAIRLGVTDRQQVIARQGSPTGAGG